jgi:hypothetical protein
MNPEPVEIVLSGQQTVSGLPLADRSGPTQSGARGG